MACNLANGRVESCKDSISGIDAVYFINYQIESSDVTYNGTNTDQIDAITNVDNLYKFEVKGSANSFNQSIKSDRNNGTTYFEQTLTIELKKQDVATSKMVKLLAYGRPHIVVKTRSNQFFIMGLTQGSDMTAGEIGTGAAAGDFNGYKLTFVAEEAVYANFLNASTQSAMVSLFTSATLVTA